MEPLPLTDEAREAMRRARDLARAADGQRADPQHILLAVLEAPGAQRLLGAFGIEPQQLAGAVEFLDVGTPPSSLDAGAEEATVSRAMAEARRLGQDAVGSEHLVVALVGRRDSLAAGLLATVGITRDPAREAVRFLHGVVPDWDPPERGERGSLANSSYLIGGSLDFAEGPDMPRPSEEDTTMLEAFAGSAEGVPGPLRSVVAIGQTAEAGGVIVELIALEVRATFAVLTWRARPDGLRLLGSPESSVADDAGTRYRAWSTSSSGGEHGSQGEITILPSPPETARVLTVEFVAFGHYGPFPSMLPRAIRDDRAEGPWLFELPINI